MKIALCCIAKCENLYLSEWVNHHLNLGFDHIYIYDNNDIKGERCADVIGDNQKVTVLTKFLGKKQKGCETQIGAYNDFYKTFGKKYDWVLFSDVDEFLVLNKHNNVNDYIGSITNKKTKCVKINWKCYGDNEQLHYENKPVVERFTKECANKDENHFYKSFYKTKISGFELINVHYSLYVSTIVDCDGNEMKYEKNVKTKSVNTNTAYLAHYVTKSTDEYYLIKKKRRSPGVSDNRLTIGHYFKYNTRTKEKEDYLLSLFNESKNPNEIIQNVCDYPFGVSVCISAWKTSEYIEECLNSVANQTWFKNHDNYEILLGIDGCKETLEKVREIMHKYKNLKVMMMDKNVGTYVTCNTIMKEARYEWLMRFDSDDVMPNDMIEKIFSHDLNGYGVVRYNNQNFGRNDYRGLAWGSHLIRHNVFNVYGGYRDWRISGDYDLLYRIEPDVKVLKLNDVLYNRRVRENSLQFSEDTSIKSEKRKKLDAFVKNESRNKPKIKMNTISYSIISDYIDYICFIIPNRGGTHLNDVINNINNVYADYKKEIIVIQQCDDELFKKGQLYNIALKHTKAKWVALTDNDIVHFNKIDLFKEYEKNNKTPYLGFTHITQVEITNDGYVKKEKKENKIGAGAFLFGMRDDFIKVNGFSNLYSGWGCEDNEISCRLCGDNSANPTLKHLKQELGHITHPKRFNQNIFEKNRNRFFSRKNRNIADDGINQTVYDLISTSTSENVTYINVRNIRVCNDFKYKNLL